MIMTEDEYCNCINEKINEHFRERNDGFDSDVFCDERIEEGVIALNWHVYLDSYIEPEYVKDCADYVFSTFPEVKEILTPCGDYKRKIA